MSSSQPETWLDFPVYTKHDLPVRPVEPLTGGIVLADKPDGISSFGMVRQLRKYLDFKKIGHAGTLDPAANGLLILCYGKATKIVDTIQELQKTYVGTICLGKTTPSYDRETDVIEELPYNHVTVDQVQKVLEEQFTGAISQIPPIYSALKVDGQPMYKKARRGETLEIRPRTVTIHSARILEFKLPHVTIEIECSKGTYIRSIAHDLGVALGTCGYLTRLRRTRTGPFDVETALTLTDFDVRRNE